MALAQFLVGHVLNGRYRLDSVLGQGGFGVVFRAHDGDRGREVAVKVLDPPRGMSPAQVERLRDRFQHEAALASRLPLHPNLVRVLDFGADERLDYLVMELLRGESLRERMARPEPVSLRTALHVLREAARGVAVGHESGLVHRDLKPANVFLEGDAAQPQVRVLDFGIAKVLDDEDVDETRAHMTLPGEWFGSARYSSPEHLRREEVTRASDVYSLGVVAFELLAGAELFTVQDTERRRAGLPVPIPSLAARNAAVPAEVEALVRRALADDPAERFADAGEMAAALHRAVSRLRRTVDLPHDATVAAPPVDRRVADAEQTVAAGDEGTVRVDDRRAAPEPPPRRFALFGRRAKDEGPTGVEGELERLRWRRIRRTALQAAAVVAILSGGTAVGVLLAASRGTPSAAAIVPAPERSAAEDNAEGLRLFRAGDYGDAEDAFTRALAKSPGHAEYMNNRAYAIFRAGRVNEAVNALQEVVAQHPRREVAYSNLAEAQLAQGDTAGAIGTMQALLAIGPSRVRRREAEHLLARLDAAARDTPEWDEGTVEVTVEPEDGGWGAALPDAPADTIVIWP